MTTIISADNGTVSGTAGLKSSADSSGILVLQTGANTTAVTIGTDQSVTFAGAVSTTGNQTVTGNLTTTGYVSAPNTFGFKNRIINGAMVINQRATSVTDTAYVTDRWQYADSVASKATVSQDTSVYPTGFNASLKVLSSSAYTVGSGELFVIKQAIEGFNFADMSWGSASAKTITISFWVYSSLTGTFGGSLQNGAQNRSYPFTYTISAANTWEQKTVTIAGDTSGTWVGATNGVGVYVFFGLGAGSTVSGTAGAWAGAGYYSATGATSVVGTNGATFYITGVQLEKGTVATSFDFRDYGRELALCQRYYTKISSFVTNGQILSGFSVGATSAWCQVFTPVQFRALPTFNFLNLNVSDQVSYSLTVTSIAGSAQTSNGGGVAFNNSTGAVIYRPCAVNTSASTGYMDFSAEL